MDLGQYAQTSPALRHLWQSTRYFIQLDERLKAILPANLREHCRVACVQNGVLVVFAKNNMAASRLKMMLPALLPQIQDLGDEIGKIDVKMLPETPNRHAKNIVISAPMCWICLNTRHNRWHTPLLWHRLYAIWWRNIVHKRKIHRPAQIQSLAIKLLNVANDPTFRHNLGFAQKLSILPQNCHR